MPSGEINRRALNVDDIIFRRSPTYNTIVVETIVELDHDAHMVKTDRGWLDPTVSSYITEAELVKQLSP